MTHDVLVRARGADARGACRRETPVTLTLPDGTLIEGVVDLAFEEGGEWTVVDYKTDREIAASGEGPLSPSGRAVCRGDRAGHQPAGSRRADARLSSTDRERVVSGYRRGNRSACYEDGTGHIGRLRRSNVCAWMACHWHLPRQESR